MVLHDQGYHQLDSTDPRREFFLQFGLEENPVSSADGGLSEDRVGTSTPTSSSSWAAAPRSSRRTLSRRAWPW